VGEFLEIRPSHGEFHICVGEFLTYGWANFQGRFWVGDFSHVGGRISHTLVGELSGSILGGRIFHISKIVGEFSHVGGRISHTWVGEFSGFSHTFGRIIRVDFGWANFSHLKNSGRISHTWVGEFSGSILGVGDFFTSQKQWAIFFDGRFFHISKTVGEFFTRGWANFSQLGGRFFRVNFVWAIFLHLKNSGRFSHILLRKTRIGDRF